MMHAGMQQATCFCKMFPVCLKTLSEAETPLAGSAAIIASRRSVAAGSQNRIHRAAQPLAGQALHLQRGLQRAAQVQVVFEQEQLHGAICASLVRELGNGQLNGI